VLFLSEELEFVELEKMKMESFIFLLGEKPCD